MDKVILTEEEITEVFPHGPLGWPVYVDIRTGEEVKVLNESPLSSRNDINTSPVPLEE